MGWLEWPMVLMPMVLMPMVLMVVIGERSHDHGPVGAVRGRGHPFDARRGALRGASEALGPGGDDLGVDHRLCRRVRGQYRLAGDRPRSLSGGGDAAMGDQCLHALPRGFSAGR